MPSPFPGMDPYLEAHWRDIRARLIIYACDAIQGALPRGLRARVEESVLLETPQGIGAHPVYPDMRIVEFHTRIEPQTLPQSNIAMSEPIIIELPPDAATETRLEIIDRESGNRVVTVVEFLSPSNKSPGANNDQYRRKQRDLCESNTNLVEIDLNRFGMHTVAFPLGQISPRHRTPYIACVRRATQHDKADVYLMSLWERLPTLKIPLRSTDAVVPLDLQALIDQCYRNGAYEDTINYYLDAEPPLSSTSDLFGNSSSGGKGMQQ